MNSQLGLSGAFLVALGGAAGSVARYLTNVGVTRYVQNSSLTVINSLPHLPWGTWFINTIGCFAIGCFAGAGVKHSEYLSADLRLLLVTGFLGGFTTFSAFGLETWTLWSRGEAATALINVISQCVVGVGMVGLGFWLSKG